MGEMGTGGMGGMGTGAELFDTDWGPCGMAWTSDGIFKIALPAKDDQKSMLSLKTGFDLAQEPLEKPDFVIEAQNEIRAHLAGRLQTFGSVALDLSRASSFARDVYKALRRVGPGEVVTYSKLARMSGHSGAYRAVGRAMATNPVPLLVPCHRVLGSDGKLGGFSAYGGLATKARLLFVEGVVLDPEHAKGMELVRRMEPTLGTVMSRVGPYYPTLGPSSGAYDALVESIIYQQLSMKAAATIASRVRDLGTGGRYPDPEQLMHTKDQTLRACGLSRQKISYMRDLAARISDGRLRLRRLRHMDDEQVIKVLCEVKGFGVWSAEMFLIFHLGRLDVWPVGDLGLRRAIGHVTGMDVSDMTALLEYGDRFRPYRSIATWYFWRYEDLP